MRTELWLLNHLWKKWCSVLSIFILMCLHNLNVNLRVLYSLNTFKTDISVFSAADYHVASLFYAGQKLFSPSCCCLRYFSEKLTFLENVSGSEHCLTQKIRLEAHNLDMMAKISYVKVNSLSFLAKNHHEVLVFLLHLCDKWH